MKKRYFFVVLIAVLALMLVLLMLYPADSLCDISTAEINNNNGRWTKVRPVNGDEYLYNSATGKKLQQSIHTTAPAASGCSPWTRGWR